MVNQLKRYLGKDGQFKAAIVETTEPGRDAFKQVSHSPIAIQLLTQAMTGALLLGSTLKSDGSLLFRFDGDGPVGHITVEANTLGHVRGFLGEPMVYFEPEEKIGLFERAVGSGQLVVKRKTEKTDKVFTSVVPLAAGEIALNFANYLMQSEQIPSGIQLGADLHPELGIASSGGVLIQAMPGANENLLFILEERIKEMSSMGDLFSQSNGHGKIVSWLFEGIDVKEVGSQDVAFRCTCTRQRMIQVLATLPLEDLRELAREKNTEIRCSFCSKPFVCTMEDLKVIIDAKLNPV